MKARSSKLLPLLLVVLVLGVAAAGWSLLSTSSAAIHDDLDRDAATAELDVARRSESLALPTSASSDATSPTAEQAPRMSESERKAQATAEQAELAESVWIEGNVVLPEGTPAGEVVEVVALGRKFKTRDAYRATVAPNGRFRVAFAPGTTIGRLDIAALHLFLDDPMTVKLNTKPIADVTIEPFLGGALRGQIRLVQGAESCAKELVGKSVRATGWSERWTDNVARAGKLDENLRFELRGLPPETGLRMQFESNVVLELVVPELRVAPGETSEQFFDLSPGARVRGRVVTPGGALPKNVLLEVDTELSKESLFGNQRSGKVDDDGSFDLRGLPPGKVTITASAPQRVTVKQELGMLNDGSVREGVTLELGLGHTVSGRVLWPDGSPAVDAHVVATGGGHEDDPFNPFDTRYAVRTNANGEFQIAGLNQGPYGLQAQGKPPAEGGSKRRKGPTWKARLESVAADTQGLEIRLVAGYSIEGKVVNDAGEPVTAFGVVAMGQDEGKRSFNVSRMVTGMYKPDDGRFELGGLLEGKYSVSLNVPGHDDPAPMEIQVPTDGGFFTFTAPRRGSIAGIVLKPDGTPAVRAEVNVNAGNGRWSNSGDDKCNNNGEFLIKSAETGEITLTASLDGYAASEPLTANLAAGQSLSGLRLSLRRGGTITGEVLPSKAGDRVDGRAINANMRNGDGDYDTTSDRRGHFEIKNVVPGEYAISAEASAAELDAQRGPAKVKRSRFDNDWELRELTKKRGTVVVADGGTAHIVLGAPPANPVVISGRVRRGTVGVVGARVIAQPTRNGGWDERQLGVTDANGGFSITVNDAGGYSLTVSTPDGGGSSQSRHVDVPAAGLDGIEFALASGRIAGRVVSHDGEELGWVHVSLSRSTQATSEADSWSGGSTQTDEDGGFEFRDLPAGVFTLEVAGTSWNRRSFEQRQYGKIALEITLGQDQELTNVEVVLEPAGKLEVIVEMSDGSAAQTGEVRVRRLDSGVAFADNDWIRDGKATREDLEPGTYEVTVESNEEVSSEPQTVRIVTSETSSLHFRLRAGGYIAFRALDANGESLEVFGRLFDSAGMPAGDGGVVAGGRSSALAPGNYRLTAKGPDGAEKEARVDVKSGETAEVVLQFP